MDKVISTISAAVCGVCGFLWGRADGLLYALIAFMTIDYITGVIVACVGHRLSSEVGFKGIAKKVLILLCTLVNDLGH